MIQDPVIFQIVVLFTTTHYATYANSSQSKQLFLKLLSLKQIGLSSLAQQVWSENEVSDVLIAAAAKMASYEAIFGTAEAVSYSYSSISWCPNIDQSNQFHLHMSTVSRLLRSRGGLTSLGLDGFLARLLSFIGVNSAFLLGTEPYLDSTTLIPLHEPFQPPSLDEVAGQPPILALDARVPSLERFIGLMNIEKN